MADRQLAPDMPELRARWGSFAWSKENAKQAKLIVARYPAGRQRSAVMPRVVAMLGALSLTGMRWYSATRWYVPKSAQKD